MKYTRVTLCYTSLDNAELYHHAHTIEDKK